MKKVFITGGTGTVGKAFIEQYYNQYKFYTLSRNEAKIADLKKRFDKVTTYVGDIADYELLSTIIGKVKPNIIIHAAALKHVDIAEKNPLATISYNILGSNNIIKAALNHNVELTVGISTDKACDPKNIYGYTKKLMEEMFFDAHTEKNRFICTRFANVAGSNGSVIPYWKSLVNTGLPIKLTDMNMNRLMFTKTDAAILINTAILISDSDKIKSFVLSKKMKSVNLYDLAKLISNNGDIEITGLRPGEKLNESLISEEEIKYTYCIDEYIVLLKELNSLQNCLTESYSSISAEKANVEEIMNLIKQS